MANGTPSTSPSSSGASAPEIGQPARPGRPNKWTASRERKLARLYLYSTLPPQDIAKALREQDEWQPGKESTIKVVSILLDSQPRWLHPKTRLEMERRIAELSECKKQRKLLRHLFRPKQDTSMSTSIPVVRLEEIFEKYSSKPSTIQNEEVFSHTILQDLLATAPRELLKPVFVPPPEPCQTSSSPSPASTSSSGSSSIQHSTLFSESSSFSDPIFKCPLGEQFEPKCPFGNLANESNQLSRMRNGTKGAHCGFVNCRNCFNKKKQYGFHDIARGARGITFHNDYECLICHQTNAHSNSYLDQMRCASKHGRDRTSVDDSGMTPAQALITIPRANTDGSPETSTQTFELFRTLFPRDDADLRNSLRVLCPAGRSLICNITIQGFAEILDYILVELKIGLDEPSAPIREGSSLDQEKKAINLYKH